MSYQDDNSQNGLYPKQNTTPDQNALNEEAFLRRRRPETKKSQESKRLSMTAKLGAVALIVSGTTLGVWMFSTPQPSLSDEELPELMADVDQSIKESPSKSDAFAVPHEDKDMFAALEKKHGNNSSKSESVKETKTETPAEQTPIADVDFSQVPTKNISAEKEDDTDLNYVITEHRVEKDASETPSSKFMNVSTAQESTKKETTPAPALEDKASQVKTIEVVDRPNTPSAKPEVSHIAVPAPQKEYKSLSQAMAETRRSIQHGATHLLQQSPESVSITTTPTKEVYLKSKETPVKAKLTQTKATASKPSTAASKTTSADAHYWLQIASLPTEAQAHKEWKRISGRCPKELKGSKYRVQRVDLGAKQGIRYRVQCGDYASAKKAKTVQASLKEKKISSLIVKAA